MYCVAQLLIRPFRKMCCDTYGFVCVCVCLLNGTNAIEFRTDTRFAVYVLSLRGCAIEIVAAVPHAREDDIK